MAEWWENFIKKMSSLKGKKLSACTAEATKEEAGWSGGWGRSTLVSIHRAAAGAGDVSRSTLPFRDTWVSGRVEPGPRPRGPWLVWRKGSQDHFKGVRMKLPGWMLEVTEQWLQSGEARWMLNIDFLSWLEREPSACWKSTLQQVWSGPGASASWPRGGVRCSRQWEDLAAPPFLAGHAVPLPRLCFCRRWRWVKSACFRRNGEEERGLGGPRACSSGRVERTRDGVGGGVPRLQGSFLIVQPECFVSLRNLQIWWSYFSCERFNFQTLSSCKGQFVLWITQLLDMDPNLSLTSFIACKTEW